MFDNTELFQHFGVPCHELLEVIDNFEDDVTFKLQPVLFFPLFFLRLSTEQGTLPVAFKASAMLAPTSAFF